MSQQIPIAEPLVEVRRGGITESRHRGHVAAVEPDGNVVASLGAPHNVTFLRSSAKPLQALPLLLTALPNGLVLLTRKSLSPARRTTANQSTHE
jgi:L-asparaginase II